MFTKNKRRGTPPKFRSGRAGFTLVEVLLSVLLAFTVAGVTLMVTYQILNFSVRIAHITLAQERGQAVLSILEPRVLHSGFGLTWQRVGTVFQRSFGSGAAGGPLPSRWEGRAPLQVLRGDLSLAPETSGVCRGPALAVLYAVPSAFVAKLEENKPVSMDAGASLTINLLPQKSLDDVGNILTVSAKNDLRSWVVFPLMKYPVHANLGYGGKLTIQMAANSGLSSELRPYDEMHYLRANRFQVPMNGNYLQSEELHTQWTDLEPRADGVLAMWFEWTLSQRLLEAWILTTGGMARAQTARPASWPAEAQWREEFSQHDTAVVRASWRIQNF